MTVAIILSILLFLAFIILIVFTNKQFKAQKERIEELATKTVKCSSDTYIENTVENMPRFTVLQDAVSNLQSSVTNTNQQLKKLDGIANFNKDIDKLGGEMKLISDRLIVTAEENKKKFDYINESLKQISAFSYNNFGLNNGNSGSFNPPNNSGNNFNTPNSGNGFNTPNNSGNGFNPPNGNNNFNPPNNNGFNPPNNNNFNNQPNNNNFGMPIPPGINPNVTIGNMIPGMNPNIPIGNMIPAYPPFVPGIGTGAFIPQLNEPMYHIAEDKNRINKQENTNENNINGSNNSNSNNSSNGNNSNGNNGSNNSSNGNNSNGNSTKTNIDMNSFHTKECPLPDRELNFVADVKTAQKQLEKDILSMS